MTLLNVKIPEAPIWLEDRFDLRAGWTEIWERGKYLGLFQGVDQMERWILDRPDREFRVRFVESVKGAGVFPLGSFFAQVEGRRVRYYQWASNPRGGMK